MNLSKDQKRRYFEARIPGLVPGRSQHKVICPFHDDVAASLAVNTDKGVWNCFAGCGSGGCIDFEKRYSNCDARTAYANIAAIVNL